ncbi:MAG: hypothetical protein LBG72_09575 [Spirochaetaceae bacterium]|jgi:hypothetical protein|nr:hypothetical protein [Spirochaetaceae bacterium]
MKGKGEYTMPDYLIQRLNNVLPQLPVENRGIIITIERVKVTLEILNNEKDKMLPQNARNLNRDQTPDGLDKRIKIKLDNDLRSANIISDFLSDYGIVRILRLRNIYGNRIVKWTQLLNEWTW